MRFSSLSYEQNTHHPPAGDARDTPRRTAPDLRVDHAEQERLGIDALWRWRRGTERVDGREALLPEQERMLRRKQYPAETGTLPHTPDEPPEDAQLPSAVGAEGRLLSGDRRTAMDRDMGRRGETRGTRGGVRGEGEDRRGGDLRELAHHRPADDEARGIPEQL